MVHSLLLLTDMCDASGNPLGCIEINSEFHRHRPGPPPPTTTNHPPPTTTTTTTTTTPLGSIAVTLPASIPRLVFTHFKLLALGVPLLTAVPSEPSTTSRSSGRHSRQHAWPCVLWRHRPAVSPVLPTQQLLQPVHRPPLREPSHPHHTADTGA